VRVRIFDAGSRSLFDESREVDLPAGSLTTALALPGVGSGGELALDGSLYFVEARLSRPGGEPLTRSLYWLSTVEDELDWDASTWFYTPTRRYADLTALATLPQVELDVEHRFEETGEGRELVVDLSNASDRIAFFVELAVVGSASGRLAAPILWSDNYVSLLPGESRRVSAEIPAHALDGETPRFVYSGVNVAGID
jgi:exo-1,4-beta-D-glucosaminidase